MIRVCFLTKYHSNGASSRYRYYNYDNFLDKDIMAEYKPLLSYNYVENINKKEKNKKKDIIIAYLKRFVFLIMNKKNYDLFIIEKELFPYMPFFIEKILLRNVRFSLDFDDNAKTKYEGKKFFDKKIDNLVKLSTFVTVGNTWYFDDFSKKDDIYFLPTVVDYKKYSMNVEKNNIYSLVWIGSQTTSKYLALLEEPLNRLYDNGLKFQLVIIGGDYFKFKNAKFKYVYEKWSPKTETEILNRCHLGVMPLFESTWEEGKCGFKLIQYLAAGLPVIASKTVANSDIVKKCQTGKIATTYDEWIRAITYYYNEKDNLDSISKQAKEVVEKNYSYQSCGKIYSNLIKKYVGE